LNLSCAGAEGGPVQKGQNELGNHNTTFFVMRRKIKVMVSLLLGTVSATQINAALLTYDASHPSDNGAVRGNWLTAVGISAPEYGVDFETGFSQDQNISGTTFPGGMTISDTALNPPEVLIEGKQGAIGGSNPVGNFSAKHTKIAYLVLDFSTPVDYLGFLHIDADVTCYVTYEGGTQIKLDPDASGASGNTAEFFGIYRNDQPPIEKVEMLSGGDLVWGIDNIEYGNLSVIPEPSGMAVLLFSALGGLILRRRYR